MRSKSPLLFIAAAAIGTALLFHFLEFEKPGGQQSASLERAEAPAVPPSISVTNANDSKRHDDPPDNIEMARGLLIDGENAVVARGDILYRFSPGPSASCEEKVMPNFELDPATKLVQSDSRGYFLIPLPSAEDPAHRGRCLVLHASKAGYNSTVVNLDISAKPDIVEVELHKHKLLRGKVSTPDGRAISAAQVNSWIAASDEDPSRQRSPCAEPDPDSMTGGLSDADGGFELHVSGLTVYCVQAFHGSWTSSTPQVIDGSASNARELVLTLEAPLQVSGQVSDLEEQPVNQLSLELHRQDRAQTTILSTLTDLNGRFLFAKLEPGKYALASADRAYGIASPNAIFVDRGQSLSDLEVSVYLLTRITGRLVDRTGQPVAGVRVSTRSPYVPDLSVSTTTSNDQGYFEIFSEHRSKVVRDMLRMASEFSETGDRQGADQMPAKICLSFYHPRLRSDEVAITVADPHHDVGTLYMKLPLWEFEGVVRNHRGEPVEAQLSFNPIPEDRKAASAPPTECDESAAARDIVTDEQGRFELHVDQPGRYEVEIKTARYKPRRQQVDLSQPGNPIELSLH